MTTTPVRYRCYIRTWRDPLGGWYDYLTTAEIWGHRLSGYIVSEVG